MILPGCSAVVTSTRVPCRAASTRSVPAAVRVSMGRRKRAVQMASRPNRVKNQGAPAAMNSSSGCATRLHPECVEVVECAAGPACEAGVSEDAGRLPPPWGRGAHDHRLFVDERAGPGCGGAPPSRYLEAPDHGAVPQFGVDADGRPARAARRTLLDRVHRGGVGLELEADVERQGAVQAGTHGDRLRDRVGCDRAAQLHDDIRISARPVEVTKEALEHDGVGTLHLCREVLGNTAVEGEAVRGDDADVPGVDAVDGLRTHRAVRRRPHLIRRPQHHGLLVQERLQRPCHPSSLSHRLTAPAIRVQ